MVSITNRELFPIKDMQTPPSEVANIFLHTIQIILSKKIYVLWTQNFLSVQQKKMFEKICLPTNVFFDNIFLLKIIWSVCKKNIHQNQSKKNYVRGGIVPTSPTVGSAPRPRILLDLTFQSTSYRILLVSVSESGSQTVEQF